jgi:hypothetical protein
MRHILLAVLAGAGILAGPLRAEPSWELLQPDRVIAADQEMLTPVRWHRHWRRHFRGLVLLPPASQSMYISPRWGYGETAPAEPAAPRAAEALPSHRSSTGSSTPWVNPDERSR